MDASMDSLSDAESNSSWILLNEEEEEATCDDEEDETEPVVNEQPKEMPDKDLGAVASGHESDTSDGISIISEIESDIEHVHKEDRNEESCEQEVNTSLVETVPSYIIEHRRIDNFKIPNYAIFSIFGAAVAISSFFIFQFINTSEVHDLDNDDLVHNPYDVILPKDISYDINSNSFDIIQYCAVKHQNDDLYKEYNEKKCIKAYSKQLVKKSETPKQTTQVNNVKEVVADNEIANYKKQNKNNQAAKSTNNPEEKKKHMKKKKEFLDANFVQAKENFLVAKENFLKNKERYLRNVAGSRQEKWQVKKDKRENNTKTKGDKSKQIPEYEHKKHKSKRDSEENFSDKPWKKQDKEWKAFENDKRKLKDKEFTKDKSKNYDKKCHSTDDNFKNCNGQNSDFSNKPNKNGQKKDFDSKDERKYEKKHEHYEKINKQENRNHELDKTNNKKSDAIIPNNKEYKNQYNEMQAIEKRKEYKKKYEKRSEEYTKTKQYKTKDYDSNGDKDENKNYGKFDADNEKQEYKHMKSFDKENPYKYKQFKPKEFKTKRNNSITGEWYHNMYDERSQMRKKDRQSDWFFDRAEMRNKRRDKAQWYFQWMTDREQFRYKRGYRFASN